MQRVLEEAAALLEPEAAEERRVRELAEELLSRIRLEAAPQHLSAELGGSVAKGTWLRGSADIDIFLKYPADQPVDVLEKKGVPLALHALRQYSTRLRYADHPYVEAFVDAHRVNVVPCFDVPPGAWKSAADRSPYHTRYMKEHLTPGLRREVRLLKGFAKAARLYGAEIAVQGFSGYVCEVLALKFTSFLDTVKAASSWKKGEVISLQPQDPERVRLLARRGRLVVFDPTDDSRDLGAAITPRQVTRLILAFRAFLSSPHLNFFKLPPRKEPTKIVAESPFLDHLAVAIFHHKERSIDVLWGQLKRTLTHLVRQLTAEGFTVHRAEAASDGVEASGFVLLLASTHLPPFKAKKGPEVYMEKASQSFIAENLGKSSLLWVGEDARLHSLAPRPHTTVDQAIRAILASKRGASPGLADESAVAHIYAGRAVLEAAKRHPWLGDVLADVCTSETHL